MVEEGAGVTDALEQEGLQEGVCALLALQKVRLWQWCLIAMWWFYSDVLNGVVVA